MKTSIQHTLAALAILTTAAFGQGTLTPPGAPAPTMKSLLELWNKVHGVELQATDIQTAVNGIQVGVAALKDDARTPITAVPFTISTPGSYYLTGNFTVATGDAITISASGVTLDLNGFTLSSTHPTGDGAGVAIPITSQNIEIKNGTIKGTTTFAAGVFTNGGFRDGIYFNNVTSRNISVHDIRVHGVVSSGIALGSNFIATSIIDRCNVAVCGAIGLQAAVVRHSTATETGNTAIAASIVADSWGVSSTSSSDFGIFADAITNSCGVSVAGTGIWGGIITNSRGSSTSGIGISGTNVTNSRGTSTSGVGISANYTVTNSYGQSTSGAAGISCSSGTVSFSTGQRSGGVAINAPIAIGCTATTGTITAPQKHLGTP